MRKREELRIVKAFKKGNNILALAYIFKLFRYEVEDIIRKYVRPGGR